MKNWRFPANDTAKYSVIRIWSIIFFSHIFNFSQIQLIINNVYKGLKPTLYRPLWCRLRRNLSVYGTSDDFSSGLLDSNQRPHRPERRALPTALNPDVLAPMVIKTMQRYTKNRIKPNKKALFYLFCKLFHRKIWWNRFLLLPLHPQMRNHL